jgi:Asp/Glu/hydantoin racemase
MNLRIGLFHATLNAISGAEAAWQAAVEPVTLRHYLDEGLLVHVRERGLDAGARDRFRHWLELMIRDGADAVMTTCSSLSPLLPELRPHLARPVVGIDDAMIEEALQLGSRVGVVATLRSAADTTAALLIARNPTTRCESALAMGAFEALGHGDTATHDRLVQTAVRDIAPHVDVVVLAQLSMGRALPQLGSLPVPVLTSGPGAVRRTLLAARSGLTSSP